MNELLSKAEAMAGAGPAFWRFLGVRSYTRQDLEQAIRDTRDLEYRFCQALSARLELLVERQALDRAVWDFISRAREQLKIHLGRNFSPAWAELGFADGQLQIPGAYSTRIEALKRLHAHFKKHRPHQSATTGATAAHAHRMLAKVAILNANLQGCQRNLKSVVSQRRRAIRKLERMQRELISEARRHLRQKNPRWIFSEAELSVPADTCGQQAELPLNLPEPAAATCPSPERNPQRRPSVAAHGPELRSCSPVTRSQRRVDVPGTRAPEGTWAPVVAAEKAPAPVSFGQEQGVKLSTLLAWLFPSR